MDRPSSRTLATVVGGVGILCAMDAHAYRMIQNTSIGRTSTGIRVVCGDPGGFTHWTTSSVTWRLNPAGQGAKAGVPAAVQNAMASWTNVSAAGQSLGYAGTAGGGFATDGVNTLVWASGNGCTGGCLAITALVLAAGQVITEADVSFNNSATWNTNGTDYDVEAIAAHEFGHTLGIHHTEITKRRNRPTMYASYFGTDGRTLESDDAGALNCSWTRYPPAGANLVAANAVHAAKSAEPVGLTLATRPRPNGALLRFALARREHVTLDVFDVAGRRVARLMDEVRDAGEHEVAWDGVTKFGNVTSGMYFARVITDRHEYGARLLGCPAKRGRRRSDYGSGSPHR